LPLKRILFVGEARPNKGLDTLLKALRLLPDFSLTIAGFRGETQYCTKRLQPLIDDLVQAGRSVVVIPGYLPHKFIEEMFLTHSLVALPYRAFSSQSGILHLAIGYGLPAVTTDVGGAGEIVSKYGIGVVVLLQNRLTLRRVFDSYMI